MVTYQEGVQRRVQEGCRVPPVVPITLVAPLIPGLSTPLNSGVSTIYHHGLGPEVLDWGPQFEGGW